MLSIGRWEFFLFFVLGTIAKQYFGYFEKLIDGTWLVTLCIAFYFLVNIFRSFLPPDIRIIDLGITLSGLIVLFTFFKKKQTVFSKSNVFGKSLQYLGIRTLDVYLIHYFLIPRGLSFFTLFSDHPMPIIEATVSLLIAIIIVAASLLIGNIIRLSPFLAHFAFGVKYPTKSDK